LRSPVVASVFAFFITGVLIASLYHIKTLI